MPSTQNLNYRHARGGLVTEEQFDLLAAPQGRIYSYEEVWQMVRDKCAADDLDPVEPWVVNHWTFSVYRAAYGAMMAEVDGT